MIWGLLPFCCEGECGSYGNPQQIGPCVMLAADLVSKVRESTVYKFSLGGGCWDEVGLLIEIPRGSACREGGLGGLSYTLSRKTSSMTPAR